MGESTREPHEWCLAYGVVMHATEDGIVVEGTTTQRIRLHDRDVERAIVDAAASSDGFLGDLRDVPVVARQRALDVLISSGAIVTCRRKVAVFDRLGIGDLVIGRAREIVRSADEGALAGSNLAVVIGRRTDEELGRDLATCRRLGVPALLLWTSRDEVVGVYDDARSAPCAECALFFDARAAALSRDLPASYGVPGMSDHARVERSFVAAIATRLVAELSPLEPGRACVWDLRACAASTRSFPRRPWCSCSAAADDIGVAPSPRWDALAAARFAPVMPLSDTAIARVAYRGARGPWPLVQSAFGIAIAAGPGRRERALGEAVERFCMLHAAPSIAGRARRDLDAPSLSVAEIATLLFRDVERDMLGFRFPEMTETLSLDWSWAERPSTSERLLVPTSLVGRPREGSPRLVDATSNGYACHPSAEEARARALLEVVERDALLLRWYSAQEPIVIEDAAAPASVVVLLATVDVDLPVIIAAACLDDGSVRIGSAAAASYESALERAVVELEGQLTGPSVAGVRPDLTRVDRGYGPRDHVAHYAGPAGRALYERWSAGTDRQRADVLRARWPNDGATATLERVRDAVAAAGLDVLFVDRSLPDLFGSEWHVVRALVPGAVEISWGMPYRRLASPRLENAIRKGPGLSPWPHPYA